LDLTLEQVFVLFYQPQRGTQRRPTAVLWAWIASLVLFLDLLTRLRNVFLDSDILFFSINTVIIRIPDTHRIMQDSTSVSLLRRLRESDQEEAWSRFVDLYTPLIYYWGRSQRLNANDTSDLVQDVLTVLVKELRRFEYDPRKNRFRGWLRTITVNKATDLHRRRAIEPQTGLAATIEQVAVATDIDLFEETEYRCFLVGRALELMQADFKHETWLACWKQVADGQKAPDVAREMNLSLNMVYLAKSRVLARLRDELSELIE